MPPLITLLDAINTLKHLPRKGWIEHGLPASRVESVGSHTFGTAMLALLLKTTGVLDASVPLERLLVVSMLHDITEGVTGDITPADKMLPSRKADLERAAARQLLAGMPGLASLQREIEAFVTVGTSDKTDPVFAIVKQLDKLDMMIQALYYEKESGKDLSDFYGDPGKYLVDQRLLDFYSEVKREILG